MITPRFNCTQTDTAVIVRLYAPAVRASDVEIHVEGCLFSVHVNPYFLRLSLPGEVVEDDTSSAVYDATTGYLTVTLTKATPGKDFKDLDVLVKLLAPPQRVDHGPIIEVIDEEQEETQVAGPKDALDTETKELMEAAQNDWHFPQHVQDATVTLSLEHRYGFLDAYTGYFTHVAHSENEVNELGEHAENLTREERRIRRLQHEKDKWDEEYYMADFADDGHINDILSYCPPPEVAFSREAEAISFTETEEADMLRLPRKEYLMTRSQECNIYLTLCTILFSYVYDARTTQNEPTPESAWTIGSLTPAFSSLDPPPYRDCDSDLSLFGESEVQDTIMHSIRRSLAFPLYRSFALALQCVADVGTILRRGRRAVLRALLQTRRVLDHHEVYYVYSRIWMDDFCRWVAADAKEEKLCHLSELVATISVDKQCIGWDLPALESAVMQQLDREPDSDDESDADAASVPSDSEDSSSDADSPSSSCSSSSGAYSARG